MRVRNLALILAIFGAAAAAAAFVVSQLPREGQVSPLPPAPVAAAPAERSPPAPAPRPGDGTIEVRVTAGPEPLAGAEVVLYAAPSSPGASWARAAEGRTDAAGAVRLPARPGTYLAAARAPGLAPGRTEVIHAAGEDRTRADVVLEPPASLQIRVSGQGDGPIAGARALLVPLSSRWPGFAPPSAPPEETAEGRTDASGALLLTGLAPGFFALALDAPGHHPVLLPRLAVPADVVAVAMEPLGAVEGTVLLPDGRPAVGAALRAASADHGATVTADREGGFRLSAPAGRYVLLATLGERGGVAEAPIAVAAGATTRASPIRLGAAAAIEGRVARSAGPPAAGAELALLVHGTGEVAARAIAAPDGRFALGPLAPGAYDLRAVAPASSPARLDGITVAAGQRFTASLALPGTGAATGTVRDTAGRPLAGVRVRALGRGDGLAAVAPVEVRTDFAGRFRLDGLELGRAEVVARQPAAALGASRAVRIVEGDPAEVDLVLPESGVLSGRISDAGHPPPPGTTVLAVAMRAGPGSLQVARAQADASGNFQLTLPAGEYRVHAAAGADAPTDLRVAPAFARVEPGRTARVALAVASAARAAGVEILVLEPGGAPSPGATVTLSRPDDGRVALATTAGEDGRVVIDGRMGISGSEVTIRARNGGRSGSTTLPLPDAGTVAVHLAPGGAVEGVVRGARAGFTLEVSSSPVAGGWRTLDVHRFAGERFALGDLPPEPLRLVARSGDGRRGAAEIRVEPGETRVVEIALR